MANLFTRIKNYFSSEVNAALDNAEDPMKLYELQMNKLVDQMAKVEHEAASVIANRSAMQAKIDESAENVKKYDGLARKAGAKNDADAVRQFLIQKHTSEEEKKRYEELYASLDSSAKKAENVYRTLKLRVEDLNAKRSIYRAKLMAADAQESINKITSDYSSDISPDVIEDKIDKKLLTAEAVNELRGESDADQLKKYELKYSGSETDLDNEVQKYISMTNADSYNVDPWFDKESKKGEE